MKSHSAQKSARSVDEAEKELTDPPGLEEDEGRVNDAEQSKEPSAKLKEPEITQVRPEEKWIPIRAKKKRSGGAVDGLGHNQKPTQIVNHQKSAQSRKGPLNHVSSSGKLDFSESNLNFPSLKASFLSSDTNQAVAVCSDPISCSANRFEGLHSLVEQSAQKEDTGPQALSEKFPLPGPQEPQTSPNASISSTHLYSPSKSAGHTPFTHRRPSILKKGGNPNLIETRSSVEHQLGGVPIRAQISKNPAGLGPIAPPSSTLPSNRSLFDHMRAAVRHTHVGNDDHPSGSVKTKNPLVDCNARKERGISDTGQCDQDQRRMKLGNRLHLHGKEGSIFQKEYEEEIMDITQTPQSGDGNEKGIHCEDPRKDMAL
ncbi:hypothetical protein NE237_008264 [Protea cynaroides]|uniref:Uncharacterized protein n=1 Tax=Protea cynaroides TaxID=273540 RepID=A0A9Q0JS76_9MAGN|nr:hypothetical protein NE237_008264 [Protea cynaroides]